jgi:hypothetical protein
MFTIVGTYKNSNQFEFSHVTSANLPSIEEVIFNIKELWRTYDINHAIIIKNNQIFGLGKVENGQVSWLGEESI